MRTMLLDGTVVPKDTTMEVVAINRDKAGKKRYICICNKCLQLIDVRPDAVKLNGYKEQTECRNCSYKKIHGDHVNGNSSKYRTIYVTYKDMIHRCTPGSSKAKNYGDKEVTVCDDWLTSFDSFLEWVLNQGYSISELSKLELDKDFLCNKKGIHPAIYSPDTCKFVTRHFNNILQKKTQKPTSSQYVGVNWGKSTQRWEWGLRLSNGKRKRGYGTSEEDAAQKREKYILNNALSHTRNF